MLANAHAILHLLPNVTTICYPNYRAQTKNLNWQNFHNDFVCIFHISPSVSILCQKIVAIKLCASLTYDKSHH